MHDNDCNHVCKQVSTTSEFRQIIGAIIIIYKPDILVSFSVQSVGNNLT